MCSIPFIIHFPFIFTFIQMRPHRRKGGVKAWRRSVSFTKVDNLHRNDESIWCFVYFGLAYSEVWIMPRQEPRKESIHHHLVGFILHKESKSVLDFPAEHPTSTSRHQEMPRCFRYKAILQQNVRLQGSLQLCIIIWG